MIGLVQKAAGGDAAAFSELYEEYYDTIYYLCFKLLQNSEDANDIVQNTFITAFQSLDTLSVPSAFESWIKTIAANKCKNYLKKNKPILFSQYEDMTGAELIIEDAGAENAADIVERAEVHRIIGEIVDKLPDEQRISVILYYYNEKSIAEIAAFMECSEGTVKSRLNYARKKIRDEIEAIEKRDGIRLHSGAILPLLGPALSQNIPHIAVRPAFGGFSGVAVANRSISGLSSGTSERVQPAVKKSGLKKLFGKTAAKVAAGVLSASVAVTSGVMIATNLSRSDSHATDTAKKQAENTAGNLPGNINNWGQVAIHGEWIYYYMNPVTNGYTPKEVVDNLKSGMYRMKTDGSETQYLASENMYDINIVDDRIYYNNNSGAIYAGPLNGGVITVVIDDYARYMNVVGDRIYYSNRRDNYMIYAVNTDGSDRQKLNGSESLYINVVDDRIYYVNADDHNKIYAMNTDGSENQNLNNDESSYINVVGGRIYYVNDSDKGTIYSMKTDGSDNRKLGDHNAMYMNVAGGRIYYANWSDSGKLYSMKIDGSDDRMLSDDPAMDICVAGEWIFYTEDTYNIMDRLHRGYIVYLLKTDGSEKRTINDYTEPGPVSASTGSASGGTASKPSGSGSETPAKTSAKAKEAYQVIFNEYIEACEADSVYNYSSEESFLRQYPNVNTWVPNYHRGPFGNGFYSCYMDINGDGIDELIIGHGLVGSEFIADLYLFDGNKAVKAIDGDYSSLTLYTDGTVSYIDRYSGGVSLYKMNNDSTGMEAVFAYERSGRPGWYYNENETISEDELNALLNSRTKVTAFDWEVLVEPRVPEPNVICPNCGHSWFTTSYSFEGFTCSECGHNWLL